MQPDGVGFTELRALPSKARSFARIGDVDTVAEFVFTHRHEHCYLGVATRRSRANGTLVNCDTFSVLWTDLDFKLQDEAHSGPVHGVSHAAAPDCASRAWFALLLEVARTLSPAAEAGDGPGLSSRLAQALGGDLGATDPADPPAPDVVQLERPSPAACRVGTRRVDGAINASDLDEWLPPVPARPNGASGAPFAAPTRFEGERMRRCTESGVCCMRGSSAPRPSGGAPRRKPGRVSAAPATRGGGRPGGARRRNRTGPTSRRGSTPRSIPFTEGDVDLAGVRERPAAALLTKTRAAPPSQCSSQIHPG